MRLGLFGGTFDPIHLGHLILAEQCRESCGLDRVWFVVAGEPPHKPGGRTAVAHRLEMARIAVAGHPAFAVSEIETRRPGPHYSVETLESVRRDQPGRRTILPDRRRQPGRSPTLARAGPDRATGHDRRGQPSRHRGGRPGRACPTSDRALIGSCRSRSRRSASPRPTSAAAWPKAGASATWFRAAWKPISRRRGCIGTGKGMSENDAIACCSKDCTSRERLRRSVFASLIFPVGCGRASRFIGLISFFTRR